MVHSFNENEYFTLWEIELNYSLTEVLSKHLKLKICDYKLICAKPMLQHQQNHFRTLKPTIRPIGSEFIKTSFG